MLDTSLPKQASFWHEEAVAAAPPVARGGQYGLPLGWPKAQEDSFIISRANAHAVQMLENWQNWPVHTALLIGAHCSGRSLLAQIFAANHGAHIIDDADTRDETELFHLWNQAQTRHIPQLFVAREAPPLWRIALPDLRSRLMASPCAAIEDPDDMLMQELVARHFRRFALNSSQEAIDYLCAQSERSYYALEASVRRIEALSLAEKRGVTIPLIKQALEGAHHG
jgi:chromosomal replication initiation ATPase DnaA